MYINGASCISPLNSFHEEIPFKDERPLDFRLNCQEPDYLEWIDIRSIRRMSRILRMGMASALKALKEAEVPIPDAILTGTAFGCLEDTGIFLSQMIQQKEIALNPTPFIQSTHNTVGSQIALSLKCYGYNQTYVQRAFSFENALRDASMLLLEHPDFNLLVGGIDELTDYSFVLLKRLGFCRKGYPLGEGSAFFVLSNRKGKQTFSRLEKQQFHFSFESEFSFASWLDTTLKDWGLGKKEIDVVLFGGEKKQAAQAFEKNTPLIFYKDWCGAYPTAGAFAMWLASFLLKMKNEKKILPSQYLPDRVERILVYHNEHNYHSLLLIESC